MSSDTERADIGKYSACIGALALASILYTIKHLMGKFSQFVNNIHYVARENFCSLPTTTYFSVMITS